MTSLACKFFVFEHGSFSKGLCLTKNKYAEFFPVRDFGGTVFCIQPSFLSPTCLAVRVNDTCYTVV